MSVLDDIVAGVREDLAERQAALPEPELRALLADAPPARDPMPAFPAPGLSVIARALRAGAELVGVNARNLKTLDVDPDTFGRLVGLLPDGVVRVAESGITG